MNVKVLQGQSLFDIAIQHCGSVEAAFDLACENDLSLTSDVSGLTLKSVLPVTGTIVKYYQNNNITPATYTDITRDEGIEFWAVEYDFKVS